MTRIGILSDTHGFIHPRIFDFFSTVDEIWHAGDIGTGIADRLQEFRKLKAVWGNIDGRECRMLFPGEQFFTVEKVPVLMMHIGGYPGKYTTSAVGKIMYLKPKLFICGHSHILKVMFDQQYDLLHINPGAAGNYGWHKSITAVRLVIEGEQMKDLEILDIPRKLHLPEPVG